MIQKKFLEYEAFVEKFKPKKTTDDCYTPSNIYDVVADYVTETYGIAREDMVRPFYPGGDYENYDYPATCCVVDNPPFSIISRICKDYVKAGIRFFLFCPYLTACNIYKATGKAVALIVAPKTIEYENGARVNTMFVTNLEKGIALRTAPELYDRLSAANAENIRKKRPALPKYEYPPEILTIAKVGKFAQLGVHYSLTTDDCLPISELDDQKTRGKSIYGYGLLLSKQATKEIEAKEIEAKEREVWRLSPREKQIQRMIGLKRNANEHHAETAG